MNDKQIIEGLNKWLQKYTESPEEFEAEFRTITKHLEELANGQEQSYGIQGLAYMKSLLGL